MQWELLATWAALGLTVASGIYKMGKQSQRIDELESKVKESQEIPIKLATLETDVKYILQNITEIKTYLLQHSRMVE